MANICTYIYDPNILTQAKVNAEFKLIHKHLCYLESTAATTTVTAANNGLSLSGTTVVLGQNVSQSGAPAALTSNREIPLSGKTITFSDNGGSATFTLDMLGFLASPRMLSNTLLTFGASINYIIFQSSPTDTSATNFPILQLITGDPGHSLSFCGIVQGFNNSGGAASEPLLVTTTADGNGTGKAGDIWISPGRGATGPGSFGTQTGTAYNIFLGPSGTGGVGVGTSSPTAFLHIKAGTATASTAPLKLTSGVNLTTPETGAIEYNGTNLFFTRSGTTRENVLTGNLGNTPGTTSAGSVTNRYGGATNFLGDPATWVQVNIGGVAYLMPLYNTTTTTSSTTTTTTT